MNKQSIFASLSVSSLSSEWLDHPWIDWLATRKWVWISVVVGLFLALLLSYRFTSMQTQKAEEDYIRAQVDFTQFQNSLTKGKQEEENASLDSLKAIMKRRPELQAKYDAPLAQSLVLENDPVAAVPFAERTFKRTADDSINAFQRYSKTSFLIAEAKYDEAFNQTMTLKKELEEKGQATEQLLYAYNELRLAFLAQQIGNTQQEFESWKLIQRGMQENVPSMVKLQQGLLVARTPVEPYMESRLKVLKK